MNASTMCRSVPLGASDRIRNIAVFRSGRRRGPTVRVRVIGRSKDIMMRFNDALGRSARTFANRRRASVVVAVLWLGGGQFQSIDGRSRDAAGDEDPTSTTTLRLCITVGETLPRGAQAALRREVSAIWRRSGVVLVWAPGGADPAAPARHLRVLVIDRPDAVASTNTLAVGELLRTNGGEAVAVTSINHARHIVAETAVADAIRPSQWNENLLGLGTWTRPGPRDWPFSTRNWHPRQVRPHALTVHRAGVCRPPNRDILFRQQGRHVAGRPRST